MIFPATDNFFKDPIWLEQFLKRMGKLMEEEGIKDQKEFNDKIGIQRALTRWKTQETSPGLKSCLAIKKAFSRSLDWILFGEEPLATKIKVLQPRLVIPGHPYESQPDVEIEEYLAIPLVAGYVGASYEGAVPWDYCEGMVWVYRPELGRRQHHNLRAIKLHYQAISMMPTIRPASIVIIDLNDLPELPFKAVDKRAIYAVRMKEHDNAAIKRVRLSDHFWVLLSDNPIYDPILIPQKEIPNIIIGRVIWSWTSWVR